VEGTLHQVVCGHRDDLKHSLRRELMADQPVEPQERALWRRILVFKLFGNLVK